MPEDHILVIVTGNAIRIETNFHALEFVVVDEVGDTLFISTRMATVAIDIGLRVADLALNLVIVDAVVAYRTVLQIFMAILTVGCFLKVVAVLQSFRGGGMHLFSGVAIFAAHVVFTKMHVTLTAGTKKLIADPAAVAGRTLVNRVRFGAENVAVYKSFTGIFGPAHMTTATTGMAGGAVPIPAVIYLVPGVLAGTFFQVAGKSRQGHMQRLGYSFCFFMTLTAGFLGIVDRWMRVKSLVGTLFVIGGVIATMAIHTGKLAMGRLQKIL